MISAVPRITDERNLTILLIRIIGECPVTPFSGYFTQMLVSFDVAS